MKVYQDAILNGRMTPEMKLLYVRSTYLMNGGDPHVFEELTLNDIELMYATYICSRGKTVTDILEALAGAFKR